MTVEYYLALQKFVKEIGFENCDFKSLLNSETIFMVSLSLKLNPETLELTFKDESGKKIISTNELIELVMI